MSEVYSIGHIDLGPILIIIIIGLFCMILAVRAFYHPVSPRLRQEVINAQRERLAMHLAITWIKKKNLPQNPYRWVRERWRVRTQGTCICSEISHGDLIYIVRKAMFLKRHPSHIKI